MMNQILVGRAHDSILDSSTLNKMFRFRYKVFYERLGWDVGHENGMERDLFDELNPMYMIARNHFNEVEGCWRLLPTTGPYMLKDTFPQLLCGDAAPQDPVIWELSRFAVLPSDSTEHDQVALNSLTLDMIRYVYDFAQQHGIRRYITVTSVALERLLKRTGLPIYRFGNYKAQRVGKVLTVACWVDINEQFRQVVHNSQAPIPQDRVAA
jgi:acyl homoserine lactone synthase